MSLNVTYDQSYQLSLFTVEDTVEDLLYEFLRDRGFKTEQSYRADLKRFFTFTKENFGLPRVIGNKMFFKEIRRVHIVKYKKFLEEATSKRNKPYAPNTINRRISSVSSFF